jgi:carboxylesterase
MTQSSVLRNPHLEGSTFLWEAGPIGVLLCHGFTATTAEVRPLAQALHVQGYTVAGPLLPGHGTTASDCNRYTWKDWYASVEQSYLHLAGSCQMVVVGGESTGALLTLYLAVNYPEIAAILCYAPALRLNNGPIINILLPLLSPFITSIPKPASRDNNPWQGYTVQPLKGAIQLKRLQKALLPLLPKVRQPILILQGRLDPTVHPQSPQIIVHQVGSSIKELHWLEFSTHCVILDKERQLAAQLTLDFLQRIFT